MSFRSAGRDPVIPEGHLKRVTPLWTSLSVVGDLLFCFDNSLLQDPQKVNWYCHTCVW